MQNNVDAQFNNMYSDDMNTGADVVDFNRMIQLGFEPVVMQTREMILNAFGKLTTGNFDKACVYDYKLRQDILYADKIMKGIVPVETKEDIKKHLLKMKFAPKTGIYDLANSLTSPKNELKAIIKGLPVNKDCIFSIYNTPKDTCITLDNISPKYATFYSERYMQVRNDQSRELYRVKDMMNNRFKFYYHESDIESTVKSNTDLYKVEKVAEMLGITTIGGKKVVQIRLHHDFYRILGRYMIVASLKAPDNHLGGYELLSLGGTSVYVFARQVKFGQKADVKFSTGAERVYCIDCSEANLKKNLLTVAMQIKQKIRSVYEEEIPATLEFKTLEPYDPNVSEQSVGTSTYEGLYEAAANEISNNGMNTTNSVESSTSEDSNW